MGTPSYTPPPGSGGGGGSGAQNTVPLASDFPTTVLGAGTVTDTASALVLKATGHGASFDVQQILQAAPSSPWIRYYNVELNSFMKAYLYGGFMIRRSSSGAFVAFVIVSNGTSLTIEYWEFSSATARASFTSIGTIEPSHVYFSVEDDGTDFILSSSPTGVVGTYVAFYTVSKTAYLASYDQIGFCADAFNNIIPNHDAYLAVQHYSDSPPAFGTAVSGTVSHATMSSLAWTASGHTGAASTLAAFSALGAATTHALSTYIAGLLDDANAATARATLGAISGWTVSVDTQSGTSGTYTKPAGALVAICDLWGGSGGGGGGSRQDSGVAATGGGSGQAGEWLRFIMDPASIDGLSWSGGAGGTAGAGRTASSGTGTAGGAGSDSTFAGRTAAGGAGGGGGQHNGNAWGAGLSATSIYTAASTAAAFRHGGGGAANPALILGKMMGRGSFGAGSATGTDGTQGTDAVGGGGASGGAGGGLSTTASFAGGAGGAQGSTAGAAGGANTGAAGTAGTSPASAWLPGNGAGGGGANQSGAGGAAGASARGCGGAGGGAGRNGNGGNGAAGADGGAVIRTICLTATA